MTSPFFEFWKQKGFMKALRKLASYETLLKNLIGNVNPVMCLCYKLCLVNKYGCVLGLHMSKDFIDMI